MTWRWMPDLDYFTPHCCVGLYRPCVNSPLVTVVTLKLTCTPCSVNLTSRRSIRMSWDWKKQYLSGILTCWLQEGRRNSYIHLSHSVLWFSPWDVYRYQPISHSVLWFSLWDVYWYQPISHSRCILSTMYGIIMSCVTWSCDKIQTLFIFRAIWENTAHVQWISCSLKGSHLIHWTSAVFPHIAFKWTPFAYLIISGGSRGRSWPFVQISLQNGYLTLNIFSVCATSYH